MIIDTFAVAVPRPPEQVFSVLADLPRYLARWAKGPIAARLLTEHTGVGARFTVTARVGPFTTSSPYLITVWEPPHRLGGTGTAGPLSFEEEYLVTADGTGTLLTQRITARPRGPFRLLEPLLRRGLHRLITADLDRLRRLVETETADRAARPGAHRMPWPPTPARPPDADGR